MSDELLGFYNQELSYIRNLAAEFSHEHPKVAANLHLKQGTVDDPHISRLIESFAFLNARTKLKLNESFPEIAQALLQAVAPELLSTIPSMAILQLQPNKQLSQETVIPTGTALRTKSDADGHACQFQTCYPTQLLPIEVSHAQLFGHCLSAPAQPANSPLAMGCLKLVLQSTSEKQTFADLSPKTLRFFLKGQSQLTWAMYELIHNNVVQIALVSPNKQKEVIFLDNKHIKTVGFEPEESALPSQSRSAPAHRLLTEFFCFPEKFLFFELADLTAEHFAGIDGDLELYFYTDYSTLLLERNVQADLFALGCTPIVNLFNHSAEPLSVDWGVTEQRVVPSSQHPNKFELLSIDSIAAILPDGSEKELPAFYQHRYASKAEGHLAYWHALLKTREQTGSELAGGVDTYLALAQGPAAKDSDGEWLLSIETTCSNRNLPLHLPTDDGRSYLKLVSGGPVEQAICITPFTPSYRPNLTENKLWDLISQLNLNHLSLQGEEAVQTLRAMLSLHNRADSSVNRMMIEGLLSLSVRRAMVRAPEGDMGALCSGLEVTAEFDENRFVGKSAFLFANVLERFFALYCSINSFTQFVMFDKGKQKEIKRWRARLGNKQLI